MMNCWPLSIALALTTYAADAHAIEPAIVSETRGGVDGAWVPDVALKVFLADHNELAAIGKVTAAQQQVVANLRVQVTELTAAEAQRKAVAASLVGAVEDAQKARREAESELASWYHNPFITGAAGLVVGVLVTAVVLTRK